MSMLEKGTVHVEGPRYRVAPYSQSSHCCFDATVLDTTKPYFISDEHYCGTNGYLHYDTVCESFTVSEAVMIAEALNAAIKE